MKKTNIGRFSFDGKVAGKQRDEPTLEEQEYKHAKDSLEKTMS